MSDLICPKCHKGFSSQYELERHLNRKTPCDAGKEICTGCDGTFSDKKALNTHLRLKRCKGKHAVVIAKEQAEKLAQLEEQMQKQQELMNMTNAVTAAAGQNAQQHQPSIINNNQSYTQNINNVTININGMHTVNPVGSESIAHVKTESIANKLSHGPKVFTDWCTLLRADDQPQNHNVLMINTDSKEIALCREGGWTVGDRNVVLREVLGQDASKLYGAIGSRLDQNQDAMNFRNDYLLHDVMNAINNDCSGASLRPLLDALAVSIICLTRRFYVETKPEQRTPEHIAIEEALQCLQDIEHEEEQRFRQAQAKRNEKILDLRRNLAKLTARSASASHPDQIKDT